MACTGVIMLALDSAAVPPVVECAAAALDAVDVQVLPARRIPRDEDDAQMIAASPVVVSASSVVPASHDPAAHVTA
jgi:hypothetical protein